jgi:hypothetical protein
MRFDVVRLTAILRAFLFLALLIGPYTFAQSAQTATPSQSATPAQSQQSPATETAPAAALAPQTIPEQDTPFKIKIVPAKPEQKTPHVPDDRLLIKNAQQIPPEVFQQQLEKAMQKALREAMERDSFQPRYLLADDQPGSFDRGIYARQTDGANVCGAIVSYNFSAGNNPQLESVTTCTPSNAVTTQRARASKPKPARPQVLKTVFQEKEKR